MVLKALYIIELTEADEGGLELVDPSWCKHLLMILFSSCGAREHRHRNDLDAGRRLGVRNAAERRALRVLGVLELPQELSISGSKSMSFHC